MRAIVVYGSFVGNTETMAKYIARGLGQAGLEAVTRDVINVAARELLDFDLLLLGSPTYEPKMIQDDMLPFYAQLTNYDLTGKLAAAFGPGDSAWPDFCTAVEMLEARLAASGATLVAPLYTIDGIVEEREAEAVAWGTMVGRAALKVEAAGSATATQVSADK
jgi:flavodoxin I